MNLEERILNIAEAPAWFDSRELRAIALEVRKREDRIKQLEDRIQRLEEAGDALKASGYFGGFGDAVNKWIKVREDKP